MSQSNFDTYMHEIAKPHNPQGRATLYLILLNIGLVAAGAALFLQWQNMQAQPPSSKPLPSFQVTASTPDKVPVIMPNRADFAALTLGRAAREADAAQPTLANEVRTLDNNITFGEDVVKDIVRDEVESIIFKFTLAGRIGQHLRQQVQPEPSPRQ